MPALTSSNLESADHDEATGILTIVFKGGATYTYSGVPRSTYDDLLSSTSPGAFFYQNIKNAYAFEREA